MATKAVDSVEQEQTLETGLLTWAHVTERFFELLKKENKQGQIRNFKTAIKFFLESSGLSEDSPVRTELTEEFEAKIDVYIKFHIAREVQKSTYDPRVSKIRKLKLFVDANFSSALRLQTLPESFGRRLSSLIAALGYTIRRFWRTLPSGLVSYNNFLNWCRDKHLPFRKHLAAIKTIETHLHVPAGTLRLPKYLYGGDDLKAGQSDFGNKMRAATAKPYYVSTDSLREEFQGWATHKTLAILPEGEERHEKGQWTSSEGAGVPSADMAWNFLQSFMGYCALPMDSADPYLRGQGIKLEELSMALFADKELVENYLEFIKLRSGLRLKPIEDVTMVANLPTYQISADGKWEFYDKGGKYNRRSLMALTYISGLLRPGTGYLYQHPEFAQKLVQRMKEVAWPEQCFQTRSRVDFLHKSISLMKKKNDQENYDFGRDPKEPIEWILDVRRPLLILQEMIKAMLEDLLPENADKVDRARQYRDIILVSLLCANPLRIRMFSIMEFGKHLVRQSDGSWWLKFNRRAFKNRRALKSHYEVRVAQELWHMLDRYKEEFHPLLSRATNSKHVFIAASRRKHLGYPMTSHSLGTIIRTLTRLYIPGEMGFGPHAFRHIIATDIIKKDPRLGFFLASVALHDKLETVETEYIHLKTSEFFEPVNTHFGEAWSLTFDSTIN